MPRAFWRYLFAGEAAMQEDRETILRLREGIPAQLRERARSCGYLHTVVTSLEHGAPPEDVYVEALVHMSRVLETQRDLILDQLQNAPQPIYIMANGARYSYEPPIREPKK